MMRQISPLSRDIMLYPGLSRWWTYRG